MSQVKAARTCYNLISNTPDPNFPCPYLVGEMMSGVLFQCLIAPINGNHLDHVLMEGGTGKDLVKIAGSCTCAAVVPI